MGAFLCESMNLSRSLRSIRIRFPIFIYASRLFAIKHFRNQMVQAIYLAASVILSNRGAAETTTSRFNADRRSSWFRYTNGLQSLSTCHIAGTEAWSNRRRISLISSGCFVARIFVLPRDFARHADLRRDIYLWRYTGSFNSARQNRATETPTKTMVNENHGRRQYPLQIKSLLPLILTNSVPVPEEFHILLCDGC